jgi:hypothetical protein
MIKLLTYVGLAFVCTIASAQAGQYCEAIEQTTANVGATVALCDESMPDLVGAVLQWKDGQYAYFQHTKHDAPWGDVSNELLMPCVPLRSDLETRLCQAVDGFRTWCTPLPVESDCTDSRATEVTEGVSVEAKKQQCMDNVAFCRQEMSRAALPNPKADAYAASDHFESRPLPTNPTRDACMKLWANVKSCRGKDCTVADARAIHIAIGGTDLTDKCDAYKAEINKHMAEETARQKMWNYAHYMTNGPYCDKVRQFVPYKNVVMCDAREPDMYAGVYDKGGGELRFFSGYWNANSGHEMPCEIAYDIEVSPCHWAKALGR